MKTAEDNFRPDEKGEPVIPTTSLNQVKSVRQPDNTDRRVRWKPIERFRPLYQQDKKE